LALLLALSGCSVVGKLGHASVPAADLAAQVVADLEAATPSAAGAIHLDCGTGDVVLEQGSEANCTLEVDGQPGVYDAVVRITGVEGREYTYSFDVSSEPR
jgi:hypothetical protein